MKENHNLFSLCSKKIIEYIILIDFLSIELSKNLFLIKISSFNFIIKNKYLI